MAAYRDDKHKTWFVVFRYKDWQGKSRFTTKRGFKTKKDALNYEHDFKETSADNVEVTIAKLVESYLEDRKIHTKLSTYKGITSVMNVHILPYLKNLRIQDLTTTIMRRWQNEILKLNLKPSMTRKIHAQCSALLNYAVKYYGLKQNPLKLTNAIGSLDSKVDFWTAEEFKKFISVVDKPKYNLCFQLLFISGMRIGELLALDVNDFDFENNIINITKSMAHNNRKITTPKNIQSIRKIDMPSEIMKLTNEYIKSLDEISSPLFNFTESALINALRKYTLIAGVKKIRIHDLRHSHATFLIHKGVPITVISQNLGHKSPDVTLKIYSHVYKDMSEKTAKFFSEFVCQMCIKD